MTEAWRPVVGFEDRYEVSNLGRVRSLDWINPQGQLRRGRVLKPGWVGRRRNYRFVCLYREGGVRGSGYVHRLVLEAFRGPCPPGMEARHLNGDGSDNRLENLAWGTHSENLLDRRAHGTVPKSKKTHCPKGHPYSGDNLHIRPSGRRRCRACSREDAQRRRDAA